jgi:DNA-binding Xre family transcriptional regulator
MTQEKGRIGSSFENFLEEEGRLEESTATAIKRVLARQVAEAMAEKSISKAEMARRMKTTRAQLDRFLDPTNNSVTLQTMQRAAKAVGRSLKLELA